MVCRPAGAAHAERQSFRCLDSESGPCETEMGKTMGDFIKELTVIDFLGILFPGAAFLLLINYSVVGQMTGLEFTAADTVLLLAGGYLLGSLVHEVGDLLEKFLWQFPGLDPRVYAARRVSLDTAQGKNNLKKVIQEDIGYCIDSTDKESDMKTGQAFFQGFIFGGLLYLIFPVFDICWDFGLCWSSLWGAASLLFNEWGQESKRKNIESQGDKNLNDGQPAPDSSENSGKSQNEESKSSCFLFDYNWIQSVNPMIQTKMVNKENYNKRVLFDGFHAMMRNLCLMAALLNLYSEGAGIDPVLITFIGRYTKLHEQSCMVMATVLILLMMVRYAHYSYLKYKYSYENFINWFIGQKKASAVLNNGQPSENQSDINV